MGGGGVEGEPPPGGASAGLEVEQGERNWKPAAGTGSSTLAIHDVDDRTFWANLLVLWQDCMCLNVCVYLFSYRMSRRVKVSPDVSGLRRIIHTCNLTLPYHTMHVDQDMMRDSLSLQGYNPWASLCCRVRCCRTPPGCPVTTFCDDSLRSVLMKVNLLRPLNSKLSRLIKMPDRS